MKLVDASSSWDKVILIRDGALPAGTSAPSAAQIITYAKSGFASIDKAVITFGLIGGVVYLSFRFPDAFPGFLWWGLLLMAPSAFQLSLDKGSRRDLVSGFRGHLRPRSAGQG